MHNLKVTGNTDVVEGNNLQNEGENNSQPVIKTVSFDLPKGKILLKGLAFAKTYKDIALDEKAFYINEIKKLLIEKDAVLVAHYYVDPDIQDLALSTGGCVSDSLEMARFSSAHAARTIIVCGVRFMGETAKILNPEKTILMPDLEANCSLDLGCPIDDFSKFCDENPDRTVVVYANTSAAVKARADWMVTSSIGLKIVEHLHSLGKKILWAPDRHLGNYIQSRTGADMLMWNGSCIVHDEFKAFELAELKKEYPGVPVLAHPESPASVLELADVVGSTTQILNAARDLPSLQFIVATDMGIFHSLQKNNPGKKFIVAPTAGNSATCKSCAMCPWMQMNKLQNLYDLLNNYNINKASHEIYAKHEIVVNADVLVKAKRSITNMLDFAATVDLTRAVINNVGNPDGIGPA